METWIILAILLGISFTGLSGVIAALSALYYKKRKGLDLETNAEPLVQVAVDISDIGLKKSIDILQRIRSKPAKQIPLDDINFISSFLLKKGEQEAMFAEFESFDAQSKLADDETKSWVLENFLIPHKSTIKDESANSFKETSSRRPSILKKSTSNDFPAYRRVSVGFPTKLTLDSIPSVSQLSNNDNIEDYLHDSKSPIGSRILKTVTPPSEASRSRSRMQSITGNGVIRSNPDPHSLRRTIPIEHIQKYENPSKTLQLLDHAKIHEYLETNYQNWGFDLYEFEKMTNGHALYFTGYYIFQKNDCLELFDMAARTAQNWLMMIEKEYFPNPYHNSTHGADVLHAMSYLALENPYLCDKITNNEVFACIIAALGHDIDHPGVNNAFMVKTRNRLSLLYSDVSINENHHCSHVFVMTRETNGADIFEGLTTDAYDEIRRLIIRLTLATDMSKHFQILGQFKAKCEVNALENMSILENRHFALELAIKCADLSNPTKPFEISKIWVDCVMEEFYMQGDMEKRLGLPVSQFMDRLSTNVPKCQMGFIDFLVNPLYDAWTNFNAKGIEDDRYRSLQVQLQRNKETWLSLSENSNSTTIAESPKNTPDSHNSQKRSSVPSIQSLRHSQGITKELHAQNSQVISFEALKVSNETKSTISPTKIRSFKEGNLYSSESNRNLINGSTDRLNFTFKKSESVMSIDKRKQFGDGTITKRPLNDPLASKSLLASNKSQVQTQITGSPEKNSNSSSGSDNKRLIVSPEGN